MNIWIYRILLFFMYVINVGNILGIFAFFLDVSTGDASSKDVGLALARIFFVIVVNSVIRWLKQMRYDIKDSVENLNKFRGWLLFFIILVSINILGDITGIIGGIAYPEIFEGSVDLFGRLLVELVFLIFVLGLLLFKNPYAFILSPIFLIYVLFNPGSDNGAALRFFISITLLIYWFVSKRVRLIYGTPLLNQLKKNKHFKKFLSKLRIK